jgi:hypothetical protein
VARKPHADYRRHNPATWRNQRHDYNGCYVAPGTQPPRFVTFRNQGGNPEVRKHLARIAAAAAGVALLGIGAASASASTPNVRSFGVSGTIINTPDEAGYLAYPNIGETSFKQIQSTIFLRKSAQQIANDGLTPAEYAGPVIPLSDFAANFGAIGLEACNSTDTVQLGFVLNPDGTFDVVYSYGASTITSTHCADDGLLTTATITGDVHVLAYGIPDGSAYALLIKRGEHAFGHARIEAQNLTNGTTVQSGWIPWTHAFDEVGAGVQADPHLMTASLDNELLAVRHTNITNLAGVTSDFGGTGAWSTDQVRALTSGVVFVSPKSSLAGATFKVWGGQPVV